MTVTSCNCCDEGTERSAWCNDCTVRYIGDSDPAGLIFHCVTHRKDIVIAITFDIELQEKLRG